MIKNMEKEDILEKAREDAVNIIEATGVDPLKIYSREIYTIIEKMGYKIRLYNDDEKIRGYDQNTLYINKRIWNDNIVRNGNTKRYNSYLKLELLFILGLALLHTNEKETFTQEKRHAPFVPITNEDVYATEFAKSVILCDYTLRTDIDLVRYHKSYFPSYSDGISYLAREHKVSVAFIEDRMKAYGIGISV